jgi:hypothetical protein
MIVSFIYGTALVGAGVVIGVALSEHKVITLQDMRSCADKIIAKGKTLSVTEETTKQTKTT